jgi:tight adherence protein C
MFDPVLTVTLIAVFASVALIAGSLTYVSLERSSPTRRRIREFLQPALRHRPGADVTQLHEAPTPFVKRVERLIPKSPKEMNKLQRRLALAGIHQRSHVVFFALSELAGAALGVVLPLIFLGWERGKVFALLGGILGYLLPSLVLDRWVKRRQKEIQNGLPDALDLLIVSLEAGLALDGALLKSAEELQIAHPALAEELRLVNLECRAGKPRIEAFRNFASRTKVDDVRGLVAMLVQTDRFGTSIAQALRIHAEVSRTKRRQRAEERAAKIGVKMVFPLVFCLFPAFYVVTLGPAVIKFIQAFGEGGFVSGIGGVR